MKLSHIHTLLIILACLLIPDPSLGQRKAYRIGPEDVLTITIYAGGEKQDEVDLTVSVQGTINAPFIGIVKAKDLTTSELEEKMTKPLARDYFVDPKIYVRLKEYHSLHYYISGAIKNPGLYEMSSTASLLELIAKAGGVLDDRSDRAYIMRSAGDEAQTGEDMEGLSANIDPLKIDLQRLLEGGDMSINPILEPGDVVYIPPKQAIDQSASKVYVEGQVKSPGVFDFQPGTTALNLCIRAGGFVKFAAPNRTRIIRKNGDKVEVIKINLDHVQAGKIPDIELKPGDRVFIPESWL